MIDRHHRMVDRRIKAARFPATKSLGHLRLPGHAVGEQAPGHAACTLRVRRPAGETSSLSATAAPARPIWPSAWGSPPAQRGAVGRLHHRRLAGPRADRGQGRATTTQPSEEAGPPQAAHHRRAWLRPTLQDRRGAPLRGTSVRDTREVPVLVTTNLPFDEWTEVFGSERLTGALLDRLTHRVHILEMNGESYRLKQSRQAAPVRAASDPADA